MEKLRAKIAKDQLFFTTYIVVRKPDDPEVLIEGKPIAEMSSEPMKPCVQEELQHWLSGCAGMWQIIHETWQIEFEREEDYVRYCFDWL